MNRLKKVSRLQNRWEYPYDRSSLHHVSSKAETNLEPFVITTCDERFVLAILLFRAPMIRELDEHKGRPTNMRFEARATTRMMVGRAVTFVHSAMWFSMIFENNDDDTDHLTEAESARRVC